MSVKARIAEGKPAVETKCLVGSLGFVDLAPNIWRTGALDQLSLILTDPALKQSGSWLSVTKKRQLRRFGHTDADTRGEESGSR